MKASSLKFLKQLLDSPGPSGFETAPAGVWRQEAKRFADEVHADVSGNSIASVNPGATPRVMFAGHIDEIGLMIVHVDDDGFLFFSTIGGWDSQVLVGQRVVIAAKSGLVDGVVGKKAVHLINGDEKNNVTKVKDLWIDIGAKNKADALKRSCRAA
jgi:endoglucanase